MVQPAAESAYISPTVASPLETEPRAPKAKSRPGLATKAGGEKWSALKNAEFYRKSTGYPGATDLFHYNDADGARAMAETIGGARERSGSFDAAGGRLRVTVESWGDTLPHMEAAGRRIVMGKPDATYTVQLENRTKHAVEVVMSVDGLDVMDGKAASVKKRGYVIAAKSSVSIDGFRKDATTVRRFLFGGVNDSLAAKAGAARNVGVIGLAVYEEDEAKAQAARFAEARRRDGASAFPDAR